VVQRFDALRFGFVGGSFPGPVRSVEVQAEEVWPLRFFDDRYGAIAEKIGQVAGLMDFRVAVPQVFGTGRGNSVLVGEVIERAAAKSPEVIVAALQGSEIGQRAEVPFTEQRGFVAGFFQKRR